MAFFSDFCLTDGDDDFTAGSFGFLTSSIGMITTFDCFFVSSTFLAVDSLGAC